ncbi:MAG: GGDEF domain-containing protein [Geobacteraceae bacterium]|nr:GGDEF domain-containing protein [Geobacteraceae bacterium]
MSRSFGKDTSSIRQEIKLYEQMIADGSHDVNPLYPPLTRLIELLSGSIQHNDSAAIDIKRLKTQLEEMNRSLELATHIDPLTGLANRRDIMKKVEQEHSRAQRHQRTYSLILVDIDSFKRINESYGINCGDDVLFEISCVLRECVRSEDICSRWGGEEFLFLLPETGIDGAVSVARKINTSIEMTTFKVNRPGIKVTASLGVCEYKSGDSFIDSVKRVEQAMLLAKVNGRNRYEIAA